MVSAENVKGLASRRFDSAQLTARVETSALTDPHLREDWRANIDRILLDSTQPIDRVKLSYEFARGQGARPLFCPTHRKNRDGWGTGHLLEMSERKLHFLQLRLAQNHTQGNDRVDFRVP
jgi:hypothetical protein